LPHFIKDATPFSITLVFTPFGSPREVSPTGTCPSVNRDTFSLFCHDINLQLPYVILLQSGISAGLVAVILTSPLTPFEIPIGVYRHSAYRAGVISEPHGHIGVLLASHHVEVVGGFGGWDVSHGSPRRDSIQYVHQDKLLKLVVCNHIQWDTHCAEIQFSSRGNKDLYCIFSLYSWFLLLGADEHCFD